MSDEILLKRAESRQEFLLTMKVSDMILEVANITTILNNSDLQGVADCKARDIIKLVREGRK